MTDQTESEAPLTPAECVEYLDDIVANNAAGARNLAIPIELLSDSAAAIRALEAKVRDDEKTMREMAARWETTIADRDRLAGEVERLHSQLDTALALMHQERERNDWLLKRVAEGQALMPPAPMMLLDQSAEVAHLTSELAAARENEARYLWLRDTPWTQEVTEVVMFHMNSLWDQAIDAARSAGGEA